MVFNRRRFSVRSFVLCFVIVILSSLTVLAQGPPLNGTPEQLFEAGMNALTGSAGTRNDLAAVDYFRRSAQKSYGPAQVVLGYLYDTGQIVVRDTSQAADWYRKAADAGDPLAQWLLGRLYVAAIGLPRDYAAAQKWLTLSANQKNPFAAYLPGGVLSERDYTKAQRWFRVAAEQGLPQAQYAYAWTLKEGRGIERDRGKLTRGFCRDGRRIPGGAKRTRTAGGRAVQRPDRSGQNGRPEARGLRQPLGRSSWVHGVGWGVQRDTRTAATQNSEVLPVVCTDSDGASVRVYIAESGQPPFLQVRDIQMFCFEFGFFFRPFFSFAAG
jgi:hypothetical protein